MYAVHLFPSAETLRYWRVKLFDTGTPNNYHEIGYLILSSIFQPALPMSASSSPRLFLIDVGTRGFGRKARGLEMTFEYLTASERASFLSMGLVLRNTGRFFCVPKPNIQNTWEHEAIYCRLHDLDTVQLSGVDRFRCRLILHEVTD
jgi:hypothetical protein